MTCKNISTHGEFTIERCDAGDTTTYRAKRGHRPVGLLETHVVDGHYVAGAVELDTEVRRGRLGTKLYEHALRDACDRGLRFASDSLRSHFAEAFWRKQEAKGRAVCRPGDGEVYIGPLVAMKRALRDGRITQERFDAATQGLPRPLDAGTSSERWPCANYVVPRTCATTDLGRARRRR